MGFISVLRRVPWLKLASGLISAGELWRRARRRRTRDLLPAAPENPVPHTDESPEGEEELGGIVAQLADLAETQGARLDRLEEELHPRIDRLESSLEEAGVQQRELVRASQEVSRQLQDLVTSVRETRHRVNVLMWTGGAGLGLMVVLLVWLLLR